MATISLDAAAAAMRDAMRDTVRRNSLLYLLQGVLMVITGLLALIYPALASVAIVRLLGWVLIVSGIFQGIGLIGASEVPYFWMELLSAVLAIVIGVLLLRHTDAGLLFFSMLFLIYFMIEGLVKVIFAFIIRPFPNWGWVLASGLLGIVFALYLLANFSTISDWMLGILLGVLLVVEGTALSSLAWRVRQEI
jgi:uncharacterized membrane protein HdeD (DUF308 family)